MDWMEIDDFPGYSVSNMGRVRNDETGKILALQRNQNGIVNVGLTRGRQQYKRSVAVLVARAFLGDPQPEIFDTPIHLDGDMANNCISNLMWRPRWFAIKYQQQFKRGPSIDRQIQEITSGYRFNNSMDAATTFGLLDREIQSSIIHRTYVWPTYQRFRVVGEDYG